MITDVEIIAGTAGLDADSSKADAKELALLMLVRRSPAYKTQPYNWPNLTDTLHAARMEAGVKSKALSAIITRLSGLPGMVVYSEGTDKRKTQFSTPSNWEELAQDVLDILYEAPAYGEQRYATIQRTLDDLRGGQLIYSRLIDEKSGTQV